MGMVHFFIFPKITIKVTNNLLIKHPNKNVNSFYLIPSLIILLIGLFLITLNALF